MQNLNTISFKIYLANFLYFFNDQNVACDRKWGSFFSDKLNKQKLEKLINRT